jgi:hypothetical protein
MSSHPVMWPLAWTVFVVVGLAGPAAAQDPCAAAGAHVADCAAQLCPLLDEQAEGCRQSLAELEATLASECDPELAERVRNSSCAGLGGASRWLGDVCQQALTHMLECADARCAWDPHYMLCGAVLEQLRREARSQPCDRETAASAEELLGLSCAEIFP